MYQKTYEQFANICTKSVKQIKLKIQMSAYIKLMKRVEVLEERVRVLTIKVASTEARLGSGTQQQSEESTTAPVLCGACCETSVESS